MQHRKMLYLQEMGIARWQVRKPALFQQGNGFPLLALNGCELLLISSAAEFNHPLTRAILKAFNIKMDQVCYCSIEQFENQQGNLPAIIWSTVGEVNLLSTHRLLTSPSILELVNQPAAKKQLWEQFCAFR